MFEYKGTEKFDIGSGYGEGEYDFFTINNEDDFWALMNYYGAIYRRFDYFLDGYKILENNTDLSDVVQVKMEEHDANISLIFLEEGLKENNVSIRQMVVNIKNPNGIYETYFFNFYHVVTANARDYLERGIAYAKSGLHNAAIRHFSRAVKFDPSMGQAFYNRGISYLYRQNFDKAIKDFTQAISFNLEDSLEDSLFFLFRGIAYKEAGDVDKAKADFSKVLELNPDDETAKEYLEEINKA